MAHTKEQILGTYKPVIGYQENVDAVAGVLLKSGKLVDSFLTEAIARTVWARVSKNNLRPVTITKEDLDFAVDFLRKRLDQIT